MRRVGFRVVATCASFFFSNPDPSIQSYLVVQTRAMNLVQNTVPHAGTDRQIVSSTLPVPAKNKPSKFDANAQAAGSEGPRQLQ